MRHGVHYLCCTMMRRLTDKVKMTLGNLYVVLYLCNCLYAAFLMYSVLEMFHYSVRFVVPES